MYNLKKIAEHLARGVFHCGDQIYTDKFGKTYRIAFKLRSGNSDEFEGGGLCEAALVNVLESSLKEVFVTDMTDLERLQSKTGIFTSVCFTDEANAAVIKTVIDAWLRGVKLEYALRGTDDWKLCVDMPSDFGSYLYRAEYRGGIQ